ncbi:MAG: calcium/sodium antiporter [Pseudomonadota bacterium]|nr:calcium/sodium antiporter [Pseudomonadota bacterium]
MAIAIVSILVGLVLLALGAEGFVRGSSIALRMGVMPLVIGLTIVAFGTRSPEMIVSLQAALGGNSDLALGNIVGSNICNVALILGVAALARPLHVRSTLLHREEVPIMILVTLLLGVLLYDGVLGRVDGAMLATGAVVYTGLIYLAARRDRNVEVAAELAQELLKPQTSSIRSALLVAGGFVGLLLGANVLVSGAVVIAQALGMSQGVIGLTVIAIGTSLPELATSVVAAMRNDADVAFGNVLGSNILNILLILGVVAMIQPISGANLRPLDLGVLIGSAVVVYPLMWRGWILNRWEGALLLHRFHAALERTRACRPAWATSITIVLACRAPGGSRA